MCTDKIFPVYPGHLCWIRQSLKFSLEAFWIVIRHYNLSRFKLHSMKSWRKLDQRQVSLWDLIFEYHCFQGKWLIRWLSNNAQLPLTCCWLQFHEQINHNQRVSQNTFYPFIHISTQELDQSQMDAYFFSWLKNNTTIFIESHEYPFIHLFT